MRAAVTQGWKLSLCAKAPQWYSDSVSAIVVPAGFNAAEVIERAYRRYNLALGTGLSKVAGKVFRIGHLGDLNEVMLMGAIAGAEMAMLDCGIPVTPGSGVAAATQFWRTHEAPVGPGSGCMSGRVVFLDRASLKARVRTPNFSDSYIEHDQTTTAQ
ncbi:serine-glyoxylate aminotransferase, partial [mine drainage metagenome]